MKNKNTRKMIAGVFAVALVLQSTAMTAVPAFADESGADTSVTEPDTTTATDTVEPTTDPVAAEPTTDTVEPQSDVLTITGGTVVPSEIEQGDFLIVKGTITSASSDITSVVVGIYDVNGTKLCGGTADEPASKTYDLNRLDRFVSFDKLAAGTYIYRVSASNASGSNVILSEQTFTVANKDVTADTLTVSGGTSVPAELKPGSIVNVKGTLISASTDITAVSVGIYDASGNKVSGGSSEPNTKTFDLSTLDDSVSFDKLAVGTYSYKVIATNGGNANFTVISQEFTVVSDSVTADTLTITGGLNMPDTLTQGKALNVTGIVTSASSDITALTVGVYDAEGKFVTGSTIAPKVKSYDLRRLDNDVKFSQLPAGKYTYAVIASNAANTNYALVNKQFTVEGQSAQTDTLTITGGTTIPDNIAQGKSLSISGTVTSASSNITALTAGVYDANGKFVTGRTIAPNAKSYNLKNLDAYIAFNTLPAGSYTYAVIASNAGNNNYALVNKQFTVGNAAAVTDDKLTITGGMEIPESLAVGKALNVTGVVTSASSNITALTVGVYDMDGKFVTGRTIAPNAKSYDLKRLDAYVAFNKLTAGKYVYAVIATNAANANYALVNKQFVVGNGSSPSTPSAEDDKLTITGGTDVPDNLAVGKALNVVGTVTSASSNITALTVGVYDADGKFVTGRTINPNSKTYNLKLLDAYVAFNTLAAGSYTYAVIATNSGNTNYALVNKKFTVGNGTPSTTDDKLTITGGTNVPDTLAVGKALNVTGVVTSASSNITALTVGVYDANGKFVTGRTIAPNAKSYDLKNLDAYVAFNTLAEGTYTYAVIATNAGNTNYALVSKKFTVGNGTPSATDDKLTISGGTIVPDTLPQGRPLSITGTVTSASSNITALTAGVYDANGKFVTGRTIAPNAKSYDLKNLDAYVAFNTLPAGTYTYAVIATNAGNTNYALVSKKFTVGNGTPSTSDALTISGGTVVPDNIAQGKALSINGTVTSASSNITALTAGVYDANGKFVTGRTIAPNAKSYDLKNLDAYIAFNTLPAGKYVYAVIASNAANTNYALVNKTFTVGGQSTPSTGDALTISGGTSVPDTLAVGKALSISGTVTSASSNITALTAGVYDANGKFVTGRTIAPNAKSYDLKNLDAYIAFNTLPAGNYVYAVIASNAGNTNYALVTKKFTVGAGGSTPSTSDALTISGSTVVPSTLTKGRGVSVRGTVTSASSNITSVTVGVYNASGALVTGSTANPNAKSYNVSALDSAVRFDQLAAGTYSYRVVVSNGANSNYTVVNQSFTVR